MMHEKKINSLSKFSYPPKVLNFLVTLFFKTYVFMNLNLRVYLVASCQEAHKTLISLRHWIQSLALTRTASHFFNPAFSLSFLTVPRHILNSADRTSFFLLFATSLCTQYISTFSSVHPDWGLNACQRPNVFVRHSVLPVHSKNLTQTFVLQNVNLFLFDLFCNYWFHSHTSGLTSQRSCI